MNQTTSVKNFIYGYIYLLAASLVLSVLFICSSPAQAQNSADNVQITLSPISQTINISPSSSYSGSFAIFNSGSVELDFDVYATPYRVKNDNYDPLFTSPSSHQQVDRTQIARWINFPQENFRLKPGESVDVAYTVNTPASIPDGGQYAALFAQTKTSETSSINSQKRVGMLLYARGDGKTINKGYSHDLDLNFWQSAPTFSLVQKVTNQGNTDFSAKVTMSISDIFGNIKYTDDSTRVLLPDTTRNIKLDWPNAPALSLMKIKTSVSLLGKTSNYSQTVLFATPTALFGLITAILLVISGGIYVFKRQSSGSSKSKS